jgi:peptidoglycan/xylan/chitin deacetylase (PgdA/CDA1 family)
MNLIIRDDDLSYYSDPEEIERLFSDIWDNVPIYFAVVPKIGRVLGAIPLPEIAKKEQFHFIGENKKLTKLLKKLIKEGKVKIVQHGYTHKNYASKFELERTDNKLYHDLKKGKEYLEELFDVKIDSIVAPHDRFSKEAIKAIEKIGYKTIIRGIAPLPKEFQLFKKAYLKAIRKLIWFHIKHGIKYRYPKPLQFGKIKEIYSYRIEAINFLNVNKIISFHKNETLCIVTHYRTLNMKQKEFLQYIVKKVK